MYRRSDQKVVAKQHDASGDTFVTPTSIHVAKSKRKRINEPPGEAAHLEVTTTDDIARKRQ